MFIMDMPPEPPSVVPVMVAQAGNGKGGNVVMQDLTLTLALMAQAGNGKRGNGGSGNVVMQDLTPLVALVALVVVALVVNRQVNCP